MNTQPDAAGVSARASTPPFRSFEDLDVYKAMRDFRKAMYGVARRLPEFEKFELAAQIRRAAISLTNNLAEGHGRFHFPDQIRFTLIARGSLEELIDDLNICSDEGYLPGEEVAHLKRRAHDCLKLINGYLRYLRERRCGASLELREAATPYAAPEAPADLDAELEELFLSTDGNPASPTPP
ncbi:MAG: four helix bundle protein [Verrucomicrobiales bacterium]|nr:four helix bundle protein [Verrucomicrobiales bacterium]